MAIQQTERENRQAHMALLARGPVAILEDAWKKFRETTDYRILRRPETGMVMVRARVGNTGARFNLGEVTCTRCAVRLKNGCNGFGYVLGRDSRHAELAALFDALGQEAGEAAQLQPLFDSLHAHHAKASGQRQKEIEKTRVEFFTLVRGDK